MENPFLEIEKRLSSIENLLQTINQPILKSVGEQTDINGAVKLTGYKKSTLYKMVSDGVIPCHRPAHGGRKLVFLVSELQDFMREK